MSLSHTVCRERPRHAPPHSGADCRALHVLDARHPERAGLEHFIADTYANAYGAHVTHFAQTLVGIKHPAGGWAAGVGYTFGEHDEALFLEHYLDRPIEAEIGARLGVPVDRAQVVEVGNLAAGSPGAARRLIRAMTALLHRRGRTWVAFTATRALFNSFARLELAPIELARADPARLPDGGRSWGSYYANGPCVMAGSIPLGFIHLGLESVASPGQ